MNTSGSKDTSQGCTPGSVHLAKVKNAPSDGERRAEKRVAAATQFDDLVLHVYTSRSRTKAK